MTQAIYEDLKNKVALVTGANGGMGASICHALINAGVTVVAGDVQEKASASAGQPADTTLLYRQTDVTSEAAVIELVDSAVSQCGRLDYAVNAAAIEFETTRMTECDVEDFDRMLSVNLRGIFLCMKHELRAMLKPGSPGAIVNIASTTSFQAGQIQPAYTASKHGVVGLTRQAAIDYARDGIRVNAIAPGNIDTPMFRDAVERRGIKNEQVAARMPLGRLGHVDEIAAAALWLCSQSSSFTTGHVITAEGGMLLG